jgi:hypothetical protein
VCCAHEPFGMGSQCLGGDKERANQGVLEKHRDEMKGLV